MFDMATAFADLGPETFGERLRRARSRRGIGLKEAAHHLTAVFQPVSIATLQRLEMLVEPPADRKRLILAVAYIASLGFDPESFPGVDLTELPQLFRSGTQLVEQLSLALNGEGVSARSRCTGPSLQAA